MTTNDKTRAERIEELLREAQSIIADYAPGFTVIQDDIEMALALPPDPPRKDGWDALRELRSGLACLRTNGGQRLPGHSIVMVSEEIDRLLADAPKETP